MNKIYLQREDKCCGCSACVVACPVGIIEMKTDIEGFLHPEVSEVDKCINCKSCEKVCPITHGNYQNERKYYVAVNTDINVWNRSSSGGIFFALGKYIIENLNGYVYGAKWDSFDVIIGGGGKVY